MARVSCPPPLTGVLATVLQNSIQPAARHVLHAVCNNCDIASSCKGHAAKPHQGLAATGMLLDSTSDAAVWDVLMQRPGMRRWEMVGAQQQQPTSLKAFNTSLQQTW